MLPANKKLAIGKLGGMVYPIPDTVEWDVNEQGTGLRVKGVVTGGEVVVEEPLEVPVVEVEAGEAAKKKQTKKVSMSKGATTVSFPAGFRIRRGHVSIVPEFGNPVTFTHYEHPSKDIVIELPVTGKVPEGGLWFGVYFNIRSEI